MAKKNKRNKQFNNNIQKERKEKYNATFQSTAKNSTKGTRYDTLNQQKAVKKEIDDEVVDNILSSNELAKIILTAPVEDSLKNLFDLEFTRNEKIDLELRERIFNRIEELNFIDKLKELLVESRKRGYALLYYIYNDSFNNTDEEFAKNSKILGLNIFTKKDIKQIKIEKSKFSQYYNQVNHIEVTNQVDEIRNETVKIHPSRCQVVSQNKTSKEIGTTIFNQIYDRLVIQDTVEWSTGQLIYRAASLNFKTDESTLSEIEKSGIAKREIEINASSINFMGKDDELEALDGTAGIDPEKYLNSSGTILSIHTGIPKQRLMGNSAGAIAGAEEDGKKYAEGLKRFFNRYIVPVISDFIDKLLIEMNLSSVTYKITIDSLIEVDDLKKAQTEEAEAKATIQKLEVLKKSIELMNMVGINANRDNVKLLVEQIKADENLNGEHLIKLFDNAIEISETNLTIEKQQLENNQIKANLINTLSNVASNSNFTDDKNKISKMMKAAQSNNTYDELMKILGDNNNVIDT